MNDPGRPSIGFTMEACRLRHVAVVAALLQSFRMQSVPVFTAVRVIDEDEQFKLRGMLKGSQSFLLYEESNISDNIRRI